MSAAGQERIGISEVEKITGLERSTLWRRYTAEPPTFPRPHYIADRRMWLLSEVEEWIRAQVARPREARRTNLGAYAQPAPEHQP